MINLEAQEGGAAHLCSHPSIGTLVDYLLCAGPDDVLGGWGDPDEPTGLFRAMRRCHGRGGGEPRRGHPDVAARGGST